MSITFCRSYVKYFLDFLLIPPIIKLLSHDRRGREEVRDMTVRKKISYRINYEKAIEALTWLAAQKPKIDIYHVAKVLYYAEKTHINKYGRPIIGDTYIRAKYGQMPSGVRDLIKKNKWLGQQYLDLLSSSLVVDRPYDKLTALRTPKLEYFSDTDVECLKNALSKYGDLSFDDLLWVSHQEKAWLQTEAKKPIDYLLMIDDDNPNRAEIIEDIVCTAQYASL